GSSFVVSFIMANAGANGDALCSAGIACGGAGGGGGCGVTVEPAPPFLRMPHDAATIDPRATIATKAILRAPRITDAFLSCDAKRDDRARRSIPRRRVR